MKGWLVGFLMDIESFLLEVAVYGKTKNDITEKVICIDIETCFSFS